MEVRVGELTLTGLDESVLAQLSREAAAHGTSVGEAAAAILRREIARNSKVPQMSEEDWLARAAEARRQTGRLTIQMVDLIREGRDER